MTAVIQITDLPALNASLNAIIGGRFSSSGYLFIRRGRIMLHKRCMLAALGASALLSDFVRHLSREHRAHDRFAGVGAVRYVYFTILAYARVPLAMTILPLALITATRGLRRPVRAARENRTLDAARLALRLGHRAW
mgnify:CR=1 FL=1